MCTCPQKLVTITHHILHLNSYIFHTLITMSVCFDIPLSPLQVADQSTIDSSIDRLKKTPIVRRVVRIGRGVVTGGRQLCGTLMRLVNAQGTSAAQSLTSSADAVSITHPLGTGIPKGGEGDSFESMSYVLYLCIQFSTGL